MSSGDSFNKEVNNLVKFKKVYESIACITLLILIFQQFAYLIVNIINFATGSFFSTANFANANLQGFISRIVNINSSSWIFAVLGILAWFGYYALLFFLWIFGAHRFYYQKLSQKASPNAGGDEWLCSLFLRTHFLC